MRSVRLSAATAVALLSLAFVGPGASRGQEESGGVSVAPMMVLMDTRGRPGSFEVINFGDQAETFRLEPLYAYIDEEGVQRFEAAAEQPGSALSFLRWAPRQFEIQPGSTRTVRLSEAPSFGQPIIAFDPSSRGAIAYRELAKEVSGGTPQRTR